MGDRAAGNQPAGLLIAGGLLVLAAVAASGVSWLGLAGQDATARTTGLLASGGFAILCGLLLTVAGPVRSSPARLLLSLAVVCRGAGQILLGLDRLDGHVTHPAIGDWLSGAGAPLALAAILIASRWGPARKPVLRLALDSLAVAIALTFALWRIDGDRIAAAAGARPDGLLLSILGGLMLLAMLVIGAVRDVRSRLWVAALGWGVQMASDLLADSALDGGRHGESWAPGALSCLAWATIGLGVWLHRQRGVESDSAGERRDAYAASLATIVMTTALLCGVLLGHTGLSDRRPAAVGILMLLVVLLPVNCLRDLVSTQLRLQLTSGLREQAFRDALTGLPNRGALTRRIAALDSSGPWVVLTLNLDGFKRVNDLLGTIAGDDLLVAMASQIQQGAGEGLAARIGGDEFAVLTPGDLDDGRRLAEALRVRVGAALAAGAPGLDTGLSVGVGKLVRREETSAASRDQLSALVESAAALRAAKARGRGCIEVYAGEVARAHERRIRLEARLARAIRDRAIRTYAQPVVRLDNNQVVGFEALARWDDEELGTVSPVEFIEMAEQTGMVVELGEQLLQSTMEEAARAGVFAAGLSVAVNASPIQLRVPGFVDAVRYEIARARIRPSQVVIEVTEAILVADDDPAMRALGELTLLGVGVAIDDFGTGYSALGYLRRLPVQVLKIDRSLTQSLLAEAKTVAIVEGVVAMAHRMGIRVVMEGIEDELQADSCRALGADQGQGWLFGRPMPWADAAAVVAAAVETQRHRQPVPAWPDSCGDTWHTAHPRV